MSDKRLKLPNSIKSSGGSSRSSGNSESVQLEKLKNKRAAVDAKSKSDVAKLQLMQEALSATKMFLEVMKSHKELEATYAEWVGRVNVAESALQKAVVEYNAAQSSNSIRAEELAQSGEKLKRLLELFDHMLSDLKTLDMTGEEKSKLLDFLLALSDKLIQIQA